MHIRAAEELATEALAFMRRLCLKSLSTDAGGRDFLSGYKGGKVTSGGTRNRNVHVNTHTTDTTVCLSHHSSTYRGKW